MRIERLARDEQTHNFARSLENQVDPAVSQKPLDGYRLLAARSERLRRFVAAPAADLHGVADESPRSARWPTTCTERLRAGHRRIFLALICAQREAPSIS